jgi:hypothetical protein
MIISPKDAIKYIKRCMKVKLPVMMHGSPSSAKSSIAKQIADELKLEFIDVRLTTLDPIVMSGYPTDNGDFATFKPFDIFPTTDMPIPAGKKGFLVIIDELPSAPKLMQSAAYRLILDREVGNHKLHKNCFVLAAGNYATDGASAKQMDTALQSRMAHLQVEIPVKEWLTYANEQNVNQMITSFIHWKGAMLNNFDPKHTDLTYACGRTWFKLSDVLCEPKNVASLRPLIDGIVGVAASNEFIAFTTFYSQIPTNEAILADPTGTEVPTGGIAYALTGAIAGVMTEKNTDKYMEYITRMPMELQAVTLRRALIQTPDLAMLDCIDDWATVNAARLR